MHNMLQQRHEEMEQMQAQLQSQQMQIAEFQQREQLFQQQFQMQASTLLPMINPPVEKNKSRPGRSQLAMLSDALSRAQKAANQAAKVAGDVKAMMKNIEGWELGNMSFFCMVYSGDQLQMHCFGE